MSNLWIQTYTRRRFDFIDLEPATINILDIAHSLATAPRFNGHLWRTYTVAEHSVRISYALEGAGRRDIALEGLLHDAAETYTGDIVKPYKQLLGSPCKDIEDRISQAIAKRFHLQWPEPEMVKDFDNRFLYFEGACLLPGGCIEAWPPAPKFGDWVDERERLPDIRDASDDWRHRFLERFAELHR